MNTPSDSLDVAEQRKALIAKVELFLRGKFGEKKHYSVEQVREACIANNVPTELVAAIENAFEAAGETGGFLQWFGNTKLVRAMRPAMAGEVADVQLHSAERRPEYGFEPPHDSGGDEGGVDGE